MYVLCLFGMLTASPLLAQEWNYPKPDPNRDVKDISFYEAGDGQPLPKITADRPKRIIFCIGDGMSFAQMALARQRAMGPEGRLHFERLPVSGMVRTFSANHIVTDSAAGATALACGVKTNNGMIGMTPDKQPQRSILELLDRKGWRTGLTVTCTLSHATPAGFASHVEDRGMEAEIAAQLLAGPVDVMFGGGRAYWTGGEGTKRKDGRDLIAEAQQAGCQFIYSRQQMPCLAAGVRTVGLFADAEMTTYSPEPMLAEMTQKAIELLSAKSDEWFAPRPKFFLMVEGSQIDWACHDNNEDNMVRQLLLFDMAVKEAIEFAARDRHTLVIVTADHETGGLTLKKSGSDARQVKADWSSKDHTGVDVPLYAYGPGAERFAGALDNTDLFGRLADLTRVETCAGKEAVAAEPLSARP